MVLVASSLSACSKAEIRMPFSSFQIEEDGNSGLEFSKNNALLNGYAFDLASFTEDYTENYNLANAGAGLLVDINNKKVLFAQNAFEQKYPASITKIFTALIALKHCNIDETIVCTDACSKLPDDAVKLGLRSGDTLTLDQALHLALISSYNDAAIAIACHVSGTEEEFSKLMNEEARKLGATSSNFTDASGLGGENHYTSAYDLYLIFNEFVKYPELLEIIQANEYSTTYHDKNGAELSASGKSTNQFFRGLYSLPENVTVVGGKTGTTSEAGYCLLLLVRDTYSNPYIAVILGSDSRDNLYEEMTQMLRTIIN